LRRIEGAILRLHTPLEKDHLQWEVDHFKEGGWRMRPNHYGLPQYALLSSLPAQHLSSQARSALALWQAKFGDIEDYRHDEPSVAFDVVSPIPADKVRFVTDDDWVDIVTRDWAKRPRRWRSRRNRTYSDTSPERFALSLQSAAEADPRRFVALGLSFSPDAPRCYYSGLLRAAALTSAPPGTTAVSWAPASVRSVEALIAHMGHLQDANIAREVCRLVQGRRDESWSTSTLDLLRGYALHHPDPDSGKWATSDKHTSDALEGVVLNSVRCSAVHTASLLLWAQPSLLAWARDLCEAVTADPHPAVRAASFDIAYALGKHDQDLAVSFLLRAYLAASAGQLPGCATALLRVFRRFRRPTDDIAIAVQHGPLLVRVLWKRAEHLAPVLKKALRSKDPKTAALGGYWATIGFILQGSYAKLARRAAAGTPLQRVGAAHALADLAFFHGERRAVCLNRLAGFLDDSAEEVSDACDRIFRRDGFLRMEGAPAFCERFALSPAFARRPTYLMHQLEQHDGSLLPYLGTVQACVLQFAGPLVTSTQSMAHENASAGNDLSTILLRLYQQAEAADATAVRARCLDLWDALLEARVGTGFDYFARLDL